MNCEQIKPALLEYVMDEAPTADRAAIATHLETCAACSEEAGKIRQTMSALSAGAAFEDVPQKIRIVAEPAGTLSGWAAFWHNPARLAFGAAGLSCLAIALLALAHTSVKYQQGNFEIAFGAAATNTRISAPSAAAPLSQTPVSLNRGMTREQVEQLVTAAVSASEARQLSHTAQAVKTSAAQEAASRMDDRREMAESFRYVQAAEVTMWKQLQDEQYMASVQASTMRPTGADAAAHP
jgi:5'-deoxynucleotidase YfbR-like HD superfamily hydrolase